MVVKEVKLVNLIIQEECVLIANQTWLFVIILTSITSHLNHHSSTYQLINKPKKQNQLKVQLFASLLSLVAGLSRTDEEGVCVPVESTYSSLLQLSTLLREDRALRHRPVQTLLGRMDIVGHDLVPLLLVCREDDRLLLRLLKVLLFLTAPIDIVTDDNSDDESEPIDEAVLIEAQQRAKAAFIDAEAVVVLVDRIVNGLAVEAE
jgi:hypothetical protein